MASPLPRRVALAAAATAGPGAVAVAVAVADFNADRARRPPIGWADERPPHLLLLTVEKQGLLFVDRNHPSEAPTPVPNSSCSSDQPTQVYGLGKTALVYCMRTGEMIVVKPGRG